MSSTDKKLLVVAVVVLILAGVAKAAERALRVTIVPAGDATSSQGIDYDGYYTNDTGSNAEPAATSTGSGDSTRTGELVGQVTLGPTCPVERTPPDPQCADKPYQTTVVVSTGGREVGRQQTDAQGRFMFAFLPGTYTVAALGGNTLPRCASETAALKSSATTTVSISCDTGIR